MLNGPSTAKIVFYNIVTLGFYFFYWSMRSRRDINAAARTSLIPSTWLLAVPFYGYWWYWKYAAALETVSFGRLKYSETYLLYLLATHAPAVSIGYLNVFPTSDIKSDAFVLYIGIFIGLLYLFSILAMAAFMGVMQKRISATQRVA